MASVQATSITSLPTELIWDILDYLPLRDRVTFLRICKSLHASAYRHLWSRFHLVGHTSPQGHEVRDGSNEEGVHPIGRARLLRLVNELGPDALGFKYIKVMGFERHMFELVGRNASKDAGNELVRIFASQIEQGKMNLSCAEFAVSPHFLIKLRRYTEQKSQDEFSLHLKATSIATIRPDLFDISKIKRLTLFLDEYYRIDVTVSGTVNYILGLAKVLSTATHLQRLVSLSTIVSVSWWRQFARCPFPEADELSLYPQHIYATRSSAGEASTASWISETDEEFSADGFRNHVFQLGDVAVRGLKRFYTPTTKVLPRPSDLSSCIIRRNKMLEGKIVERYMEDFREDLDRECRLTLNRAYRSCGDTLRIKLENCLEEHIRMNAKEYAREVPGFDAGRKCGEALARAFEEEIAPAFVKEYVDKLLKRS
ncbi:hypothetical protein AA313_de0208740 [Arthrobotrys entomopaga]|nr:hypothetical protein AA313_de0208740 [Arthrobotrys entomopaga]